MNKLSEPIATAGVFAQVSTDQTQRQVTTLIIVLIVVALLLATLTAWFWHHTDPRRRAFEESESRRETADEETTRRQQGSLASQRDADLRAANASLLADDGVRGTREANGLPARHTQTVAGASNAAAAVGDMDDDGMSADEWIRLTGPAPKRNPGSGA